jgi:hypothetical protein
MADIFTVALIKGAVEGNLYAHFGSLLGIDGHIAVAEEAGFMKPAVGWAEATDKAHRVYRECGLADLPEGRAYLAWTDRPEVTAALALLAQEGDQTDHG